MAEAIEKGHATLVLSGKNLQGGFALTRTGRGMNERWIPVKMKDDFARADIDILESEPNSVLTGRSVDEVGEDE